MIHNPATARMHGTAAAVIQDVGMVAAGFFERIGQNRHVFKAALIVNGSRDGSDGGAPGGIECHGAEGIGEDTANKVGLFREKFSVE
jgi:hypothetical protein